MADIGGKWAFEVGSWKGVIGFEGNAGGESFLWWYPGKTGAQQGKCYWADIPEHRRHYGSWSFGADDPTLLTFQFDDDDPDPGKRRIFSAIVFGSEITEFTGTYKNPGWPDGRFRVSILRAAAVKKIGPRLGLDGPIPDKFKPDVRAAIDIAWRLNDDPDFARLFHDTVVKLSGDQSLPPDIYAITLNKMEINLFETSADPRLPSPDEIDKQEGPDIARGSLAGPTPAFSFRNGKKIWIREFSLKKGPRAIAAHIFHEGAHLAGAPGNAVAELALDVLHKKADIPR